MADSSLTKQQGLALLSKLAADDAFRARFEQKPAHALSEAGIPAQQVVELPPACLCPRKLASKQEMEAARQKLAADVDTSMLALIVPTAKV
jgi:putative modified peptide